MKQVRAVVFYADNVQIEYADARDLRANGLVAQHQINIPATEEYADRLDNLVEAVIGLLDAALTDFDSYPAAIDSAATDDEASPYDNPIERPDVPLPDQD